MVRKFKLFMYVLRLSWTLSAVNYNHKFMFTCNVWHCLLSIVDGKEYDAFISYKSSKEDEDFVLHQLYPKLEEEMGFKLCMHFRDFTPGDSKHNDGFFL